MRAAEAKEYGLIDEVLERKKAKHNFCGHRCLNIAYL